MSIKIAYPQMRKDWLKIQNAIQTTTGPNTYDSASSEEDTKMINATSSSQSSPNIKEIFSKYSSSNKIYVSYQTSNYRGVENIIGQSGMEAIKDHIQPQPELDANLSENITANRETIRGNEKDNLFNFRYTRFHKGFDKPQTQTRYKCFDKPQTPTRYKCQDTDELPEVESEDKYPPDSNTSIPLDSSPGVDDSQSTDVYWSKYILKGYSTKRENKAKRKHHFSFRNLFNHKREHFNECDVQKHSPCLSFNSENFSESTAVNTSPLSLQRKENEAAQSDTTFNSTSTPKNCDYDLVNKESLGEESFDAPDCSHSYDDIERSSKSTVNNDSQNTSYWRSLKEGISTLIYRDKKDVTDDCNCGRSLESSEKVTFQATGISSQISSKKSKDEHLSLTEKYLGDDKCEALFHDMDIIDSFLEETHKSTRQKFSELFVDINKSIEKIAESDISHSSMKGFTCRSIISLHSLFSKKPLPEDDPDTYNPYVKVKEEQLRNSIQFEKMKKFYKLEEFFPEIPEEVPIDELDSTLSETPDGSHIQKSNQSTRNSLFVNYPSLKRIGTPHTSLSKMSSLRRHRFPESKSSWGSAKKTTTEELEEFFKVVGEVSLRLSKDDIRYSSSDSLSSGLSEAFETMQNQKGTKEHSNESKEETKTILYPNSTDLEHELNKRSLFTCEESGEPKVESQVNETDKENDSILSIESARSMRKRRYSNLSSSTGKSFDVVTKKAHTTSLSLSNINGQLTRRELSQRKGGGKKLTSRWDDPEKIKLFSQEFVASVRGSEKAVFDLQEIIEDLKQKNKTIFRFVPSS